MQLKASQKLNEQLESILMIIALATVIGAVFGICIGFVFKVFSSAYAIEAGVVAGMLLADVLYLYLLINLLKLIKATPTTPFTSDDHPASEAAHAPTYWSHSPKNEITIDIIGADKHKIKSVHLPLSHRQMVRLSEHIVSGGRFTEDEIAGGGMIFSRPQLVKLREAMLKYNLLTPKNDKTIRGGVELTPMGEDVIRYFASNPNPPTSRGNGHQVLYP
jgi:hypothetical protein